MKSKKINYPIVLKPINEGSSLGVEICKNKEKLSDSISSMHLFFISSKTFKSPVASFTPIMFGFVQSLLIVLTSILLAVLEGTL